MTRFEILQAIARGEVTPEQGEALFPKRSGPSLSFKVSEKGCVSVYGVWRRPVTLYASGWERILDRAADLRAFIAENAALLARKPEGV